MKKICFLTVLIVLICFPLAAAAAGGVEFEVTTGEPIVGKDLTVTIRAKAGDSGWASFMADFTYDPNVMTPKADDSYQILIENALASVNMNYSGNSCRVVAASSKNIKADTDIASLTFTVKKSVAPETEVVIGLDVKKDNALVVGEDGFTKAAVTDPTMPAPKVKADPGSIRVASPPGKTSYLAGDRFDPTGMVIEFTDRNGATSDVTGAVTLSPSAGEVLTKAHTAIAISYLTPEAVTLTASQAITVTELIAVQSVTLDKAALSLPAGGSASLYATLLPQNATNQSVSWSTSNAAVAAVSGGAVTGVSEGTATITVTTVDGGKSASCLVTVTERAEMEDDLKLDVTIRAIALKKSVKLPKIPGVKGTWSVLDETVAKITVSKKGVSTVKALKEGVTTLCFTPTEIGVKSKIPGVEKAVAVGKTYDMIELRVRKPAELAKKIKLDLKKLTLHPTGQNTARLTYTLTPEGAVRDPELFWVMSKPGIVTVGADGTVTALKPGKTKITVYTTNMKTDSVEVTVQGGVTSVRILNAAGKKLKKASLKVGDKLPLSIKINDDALDKSVTWKSSNEAVATVDQNGIVTAVKKGKATITATANDGSKEKASCKITVKK